MAEIQLTVPDDAVAFDRSPAGRSTPRGRTTSFAFAIVFAVAASLGVGWAWFGPSSGQPSAVESRTAAPIERGFGTSACPLLTSAQAIERCFAAQPTTPADRPAPQQANGSSIAACYLLDEADAIVGCFERP